MMKNCSPNNTISGEVTSAIITAENELARREKLVEVRRALLNEANAKQEEAKRLRSLAHEIHLLINDTPSLSSSG
jgi:hypothetical protein